MYYRYRAAAFSGVRSFTGVATGGVRVCAVYACTTDSRDTCGLRFPSYIANTTAIFDQLTIVATMPTPVRVPALDTDDFIVYPVSSKVTIMPLETNEYTYNNVRNNNVTVHTMTLNNRTAELYGFALWGRRFLTDGQVEDPPLSDEESEVTPDTVTEVVPGTTPGSSSVHFLSRALLASLVLVIIFSKI